MRQSVIVIALMLLLACGGGTPPAPRVDIDGELLTGKLVADDQVAAFLGVPFAEPPVGKLRWREPQPLETKLERRTATAFAPACMQTMRILDWYRYMAEAFGGSRDYYADLEISEDCLYLNVWTPSLDPSARLPVMVWVHGGSNRSGWSYELNYHGHVLAQKNVVVVSIAYRQGVFGFLSDPGLDRDAALANFGLWDIVAALRWIQRNIEQFGGDPDRVTMFGESAGAENILALMFAQPAQGLFHRSILESTAGYGIDSVATVRTEQQRAVELAALLDLDAQPILDGLRKFAADELLEIYEGAFSDYYHAPALDGRLLSESTWNSIQAARFRGHQIIIGSNSGEWLDYLDEEATADDVVDAAAELKQIDSTGALVAVADENDPRRAMDRMIGAETFVCPSQNTAARLNATGGDAWVYYFTRARDDEGGRKLGAYHGAELPYVFGTHDAYMRTNAVDRVLTEAIMDYWVQFAATGNPNSDRTPDWPQFAAPDFPVQELGEAVRTIAAPEAELCRLFEIWNAGRD